MIGVVVMAYGTPAGPDDLEPYYTHVRGGRPAPPELVAELAERYGAIGWRSPLAQITRAQAASLARELEAAAPGRFRVAVGFKHAEPWIEDAVHELLDAGVERLVGIALAPHFSALSVGSYAKRLREAAGGTPVAVVRSWHLAAPYVELLAGEVLRALRELGPDAAGAEVVFTAHSLPERILALGDPYPEQLRETARAVAERAGLPRWSVAWQSAGRTADPWLGPDVLEVLRARAGTVAPAVVVCPAGFVADHLELLYDLDLEAAGLARELGIAFARTRAPNDAPLLAQALAGAVLAAAGAPAPAAVA